MEKITAFRLSNGELIENEEEAKEIEFGEKTKKELQKLIEQSDLKGYGYYNLSESLYKLRKELFDILSVPVKAEIEFISETSDPFILEVQDRKEYFLFHLSKGKSKAVYRERMLELLIAESRKELFIIKAGYCAVNDNNFQTWNPEPVEEEIQKIKDSQPIIKIKQKA